MRTIRGRRKGPASIASRVAAPLVPLALLMILTGGCQAMYFLTSPDTAKPVKAEYAKIEAQKLAVVVWADRSTQDVDPLACRRVCDAIIYDMKKNLPKARFVSAKEVESAQKRAGLAWESMSPREQAAKFSCDLLLRVDLLEYTTRAGDSAELRRGRVRGTLNLYECAADASEEAVYESEVVATYPSTRDHSVDNLRDSDLMRETVSQFGQAVARKFYDHEVSYRGPSEK